MKKEKERDRELKRERERERIRETEEQRKRDIVKERNVFSLHHPRRQVDLCIVELMSPRQNLAIIS